MGDIHDMVTGKKYCPQVVQYALGFESMAVFYAGCEDPAMFLGDIMSRQPERGKTLACALFNQLDVSDQPDSVKNAVAAAIASSDEGLEANIDVLLPSIGNAAFMTPRNPARENFKLGTRSLASAVVRFLEWRLQRKPERIALAMVNSICKYQVRKGVGTKEECKAMFMEWLRNQVTLEEWEVNIPGTEE